MRNLVDFVNYLEPGLNFRPANTYLYFDKTLVRAWFHTIRSSHVNMFTCTATIVCLFVCTAEDCAAVAGLVPGMRVEIVKEGKGGSEHFRNGANIKVGIPREVRFFKNLDLNIASGA